MREGVLKNPGKGEQMKTRDVCWMLHKKSLLYFLFFIFVTVEILLILNSRKEARAGMLCLSEPAATKQEDWQWTSHDEV